MKITISGSMQFAEKMLEAKELLSYYKTETQAVNPTILNLDLSNLQ